MKTNDLKNESSNNSNNHSLIILILGVGLLLAVLMYIKYLRTTENKVLSNRNSFEVKDINSLIKTTNQKVNSVDKVPVNIQSDHISPSCREELVTNSLVDDTKDKEAIDPNKEIKGPVYMKKNWYINQQLTEEELNAEVDKHLPPSMRKQI